MTRPSGLNCAAVSLRSWAFTDAVESPVGPGGQNRSDPSAAPVARRPSTGFTVAHVYERARVAEDPRRAPPASATRAPRHRRRA